MAKLPGGVQVNKTLGLLVREVRAALKQINAEAGRLLSRGDYTGAESLVEKAKLVGDFQTQVETLRTTWKEIRSGGRKRGKSNQKSALWEYYQPILKALVGEGGSATTKQLEPHVETLMEENLKPCDYDLMAGNRPRWKIMIRRARKHMINEGFVEDNTGFEWKITKQGRKAVERPAGSSSPG